MHKKGFTLIELIMVITILGILAVVAIPRFIDLREDARNQAERGVEAAIEAGAQIHKAKWLIDATSSDLATSFNTDTGFPTNWQDCLDSNTTADISSDYNISYSDATGNATAESK